MKLFSRFFSLLFCLQSFSQTANNSEKIKEYINTYFHYDREIIHVQFNKNIYINNEDIAFKGYVFSKNNNIPNNNTTNVELVVYDDQQQIIQKQLLFTENGTFKGGIHLNEKFKPGKYNFHFYTNWMNNFKEDDSFNQTVEIISKNNPYVFEANDPDWKTAEISLFPEGGNIIDGIINTVGIKIKDCNKKGLEIMNGVILDSKSNDVAHFQTNSMGNGVFYLKADLKEKYTLKINSEKLNISQPLGKIAETGIILSYNNNLAKNNLLVVLKTNEKGLQLYQNKKFILLVEQDGNFMQQEITFNNNKTEQPCFFDKKILSNGVNTIRVLDEDLNEVTERLVYIENNTTPITTLEAKATSNDSIMLSGKTEVNKAHLSISILPEKSVCMNQKKSISGTFYLNAYLEKTETNTYPYYDLDNKNRKQDLELLMLNQNKGKFLWENIKSDPPKINYQFEKGVTLSGKVEKELKPNSKNKISLISLKDNSFEEASIDEHNDFKFEHFYAQDSTVLAVQMINEKNAALFTKIEARVSRDEPRFILGPLFEKITCPVLKTTDNVFNFASPKPEDKAIELEGIAIKNNFKKEILTHKNSMSPVAKAFKIKEGEYRTVLSFLTSNGYNTGINQNDNTVYVRNSRGAYLGDSASSPSVYIDDILAFDFNQLLTLTLDQIDEIYIDQSGSSDVSSVGHGTIKIYMKKGQKSNYFKPKFTTFIVTKGFAQNINYKNSRFENQEEFNYFGTLNWSPDIDLKDDHLDYQIKFPKNNQKEIQVLIEGFSEGGQLISEVKKIHIGGNS
ncbi:hypothetical protein [Flavobacterium chungangense]|uniref:TonB-dependent receptor plug domain-containing protein n=1 Tax=Flavobacterium chungangense TaxID=554283 RepID=A0A6V6Z5J5_9FLAO|nr:hypothetical protein [Flavobacterium chungangense]CAD0007043.1 hypothetical protein FLACHUCJ7_03118 [Flavobacterium chungangense]